MGGFLVLRLCVLLRLIWFWFRFLQEAMKKAEAAGNDDCPVKIKLVAPPLYVLTTQTLDKVWYRKILFLAQVCFNMSSAWVAW